MQNAPILIRTRRGAYAALVLLTLLWGFNWAAMKIGLRYAHPVIFNIERTLVAVVLLFAVMLWQRRPLRPGSWIAVIVIGLCQTTVNFGATTMALAGGGAGRTAVLVYAMPFWSMLIAWPVLQESVRGAQWPPVILAMAGLALVVEPWHWQGDLAPKLWATFSGLGWGAGAVAIRYFQRRYRLDMINLTAWQMVAGLVPLCLIPLVMPLPASHWTLGYGLTIAYVGILSTGIGFVLWTAVLGVLPVGTASLNMFAIPVIGLLSSMAIFGEQISLPEWLGILAIGAALGLLSRRAFRMRRVEPEAGAPATERG